MSKKFAAVAGLLGMAVGAVAGSSYLEGAGSCAAPGSPQLQCTLNTAIAPFVGAIAIGFVAALIVGHLALRLIERTAGRQALRVEQMARPKVTVAREPEAAPRAVSAPYPAPRRDVSLGSRGKPRPTPREVH